MRKVARGELVECAKVHLPLAGRKSVVLGFTTANFKIPKHSALLIERRFYLSAFQMPTHKVCCMSHKQSV